jgi:hypothetical protein
MSRAGRANVRCHETRSLHEPAMQEALSVGRACSDAKQSTFMNLRAA